MSAKNVKDCTILNIEEKVKEWDRKQRIMDKEKIKVRQKNWRKKNKEHNRKRWLLYLEHNVQKKIKNNIGNRLRHSIRMRSFQKNEKSFQVLNFSLQELCDHLESKFKDGMSWDNYGEWHIDHKTPDSWFNYNSPDDEEFQKSWSLENLQPMWKQENLSKCNRYSD